MASRQAEVIRLLTIGLVCGLSLTQELYQLQKPDFLPKAFWSGVEERFPQFAHNFLTTAAQVFVLDKRNLDELHSVSNGRHLTQPELLSTKWCGKQEIALTIESFLGREPRSAARFDFWNRILSRFFPPKDIEMIHQHGCDLGDFERVVRDTVHRAFLKLCESNCWRIVQRTLDLDTSCASFEEPERLLAFVPRTYFPRLNLDRCGAEDQTALMVASREGHVRVMEVLLSHGALADAVNSEGKTALIMAVEKGVLDAVQVLLRWGADPNHMTFDGDTSLSTAAEKGWKDLVQLLLRRGANPDLHSTNGWTPLMRAVRHGHRSIANVLLDKNADPDIVVANCTALGIAFRLRDKKSILLLSRRGAEPQVAIASLPSVASRTKASKFLEHTISNDGLNRHGAIRRIRLGFNLTFDKLSRSLVGNVDDKGRVESSYRSPQTWWSKGVEGIKRLMDGYTPTTVLEILRVLLIIGPIASLMDDFEEEGIRPCIDALSTANTMTRRQHQNLLSNGNFEMFKHDINRWADVFDDMDDRTRLQSWAMDLWGESRVSKLWTTNFRKSYTSANKKLAMSPMDHFATSIKLYVSSAETLFDFNLSEDLASSQEPSPTPPQQPPRGHNEGTQVGPETGAEHMMVDTAPDALRCEEPPDWLQSTQHGSAKDAAYLMAGAAFTILFLFLIALRDDSCQISQQPWGSGALKLCRPVIGATLASVVDMVYPNPEQNLATGSSVSKLAFHLLGEYVIEFGRVWNLLTLYTYFQCLPLADGVLSSIKEFCDERFTSYMIGLNDYLLLRLVGMEEVSLQGQPSIYEALNASKEKSTNMHGRGYSLEKEPEVEM
ncbi:hypothetical protein EDB81DRAFT_883583 [Dactylonectria macrodidyma]|uniref:Uncharacterized protein n=1 Tax=Dactylonectria macrodidyma TaxID=307937 RepID=A0A9P9J3X4_9HYPO|nr:hypothetical protein EDB81DRAFT_883583 [Dactylonectria macrodidyma]